jgi:hypothetical protein
MVERCLGCLQRDGAVILKHAVHPETMDVFLAAMREYNDEPGTEGAGCALARCKEKVLPLMAHPVVMVGTLFLPCLPLNWRRRPTDTSSATPN